MNKTQIIRIIIILGIGAVIIFASLKYQRNLQAWLRNDSPEFVRRLAASVSKYVHATESAPATTKRINEVLESKLNRKKNPFGLPDVYNFNPESYEKYKTWIDETLKESELAKHPAIVIDKAAYTLTVYQDGKKMWIFPIELGFNPVHDKFLEGDGCTPEGRYRIARVKDKGQTSFYRAFLLDYPRLEDTMELLKLKAEGMAPVGASAGSLIEIHGNGFGKKGNQGGTNWTLGCIALRDSDMDVLFNYGIENKTPVTIVRYGIDS